MILKIENNKLGLIIRIAWFVNQENCLDNVSLIYFDF
jgi:hypothetical protein